MNKIAIRAKMGIWVYYISFFTFAEVNCHVKRVDNELHKSKTLNDLLQRSITDNYKRIAEYLQTQEERFFSSLVLAVYDGDPKWREVRLEYENDDDYYDLGILEFTGEEKIFPVDGQHRVEGIKAALNANQELANEKVPVIFIGHRSNEEGMQRARRLFSTLNRYAKPVSLSDIIALDEDDIVAIVTRDFIENHKLFADMRIVNTKQKAIPESNKVAFTSIITFYECNCELLNLFLKNKDVKSDKGKLKGRSKVNYYRRFRPDVSAINEYKDLCYKFWDSFVNIMSVIQEYLYDHIENAPAEKYRNREGGNLLFRPIGLKPFVIAAIRLSEYKNNDFTSIFKMMNMIDFQISHKPWRNVVWSSISKRMISSPNTSLLLSILMYLTDTSSLSEKEKEKMFKEYADVLGLREDEIETAKEELDSCCRK
jgi:DNA sulfur modification protein DndB